MKRSDSKFFIKLSPLCMVIASVLLISNDALAARGSVSRTAPVAAARKSSASAQTTTTTTTSETTTKTSSTSKAEEIVNKSDKFGEVLTSETSSDDAFDDLAAQIRQQRAVLDAKESTESYQATQRAAAVSGKNSCDTGLRKCMQAECGADFTKCALDGDTIMGDKFNKCRRDLECTGEEFKLFTNEIKADRDLNVKLMSYNDIIDCGNAYNKCMVSECGNTFNKCLGKANADRAIQNCASVAKECVEQDSGLASRFGVAIGKLREVAETEVKADEEHMYELRDLMRKQCEHMGASFDERSFDCVYNVKFFAGDDQQVPMASRNMYAGDTFVCMQEFFGINATTYKENAYRETRAQTAASSAMLGSGLGTAAGLVTSGAVGRALDTQKAKKALKEECRKDLGYKIDANGNCVSIGKAAREIEATVEEKVDDLQQKGKKLRKGVHEQVSNEIDYANENAEKIKQLTEKYVGTVQLLSNGAKVVIKDGLEVFDATTNSLLGVVNSSLDIVDKASGTVVNTLKGATEVTGNLANQAEQVYNIGSKTFGGIATMGGSTALEGALSSATDPITKAMNNHIKGISPEEAQRYDLMKAVGIDPEPKLNYEYKPIQFKFKKE